MSSNVDSQSYTKEVKYRLGELFCGPGGLARGALNALVEVDNVRHQMVHAWANDYDEDSCRTYADNICGGNRKTVHFGDVRTLDLASLGKIEGFAYGFPCNDFSVVGEQKGFGGEFGPLYSYGVEVLNLYKPDFFIAENVKGLATANDGLAFEVILNALSTAGDGYLLTPHLYRFEQYGVPQIRHRLIIVGIAAPLKRKYLVPAPTTETVYRTCREAIETPPIAIDAQNNERTAQSRLVVERLQHTLPGENAWTADLPERLKLNVRGAKLSQIYRRLHPDKPSYTITGSGGGGTHGYHWEEPRALTNRERARLQTFPDDYVFAGKKESVRKQIGMAVPPISAEVIAEAILKTMAGVSYDSVPENHPYPA